MANNHSSPTISACVFQDNYAGIKGGGVYNDGSKPRLADCTFAGNTATGGGGMASEHGGFSLENPLIATGCTFIDNEANSGGGVHIWGGSAVLIDCVFSHNSAVDHGGAAHFSSTTVSATGCLFEGNAGASGGAVYTDVSPTSLFGCTFSRNTAELGSGWYDNYPSSTTATGCIWWGDSIYETSPVNAPTITYSDVEGGCTVDAGCTTDETGNIDADPLFVDALAGDLHLQADSPCIDTGSTDALPADTADLDDDGDVLEDIPFDLDGNPRVVGTAVDIGAYEYQP
jgi:hypothetical protein